MKRIIYVLLFIVVIMMISCSKKIQNPPAVENMINFSEIEYAKQTGEIRSYEAFQQEMETKKEVIRVADIIPPSTVKWLETRKNITPDTILCFEDKNCPDSLKCIVQCQFIEGEMSGAVRACRREEWIGSKEVKFTWDIGFCLKWPQY